MNKLFKIYIDYRIRQILIKYKHLKELIFFNIDYSYDGNVRLIFTYLNENDFSEIKTNCKEYCSECDCNKFRRLNVKLF